MWISVFKASLVSMWNYACALLPTRLGWFWMRGTERVGVVRASGLSRLFWCRERSFSTCGRPGPRRLPSKITDGHTPRWHLACGARFSYVIVFLFGGTHTQKSWSPVGIPCFFRQDLNARFTWFLRRREYIILFMHLEFIYMGITKIIYLEKLKYLIIT
jgi:hypothetical protein